MRNCNQSTINNKTCKKAKLLKHVYFILLKHAYFILLKHAYFMLLKHLFHTAETLISYC